jgi:hypothetical protein
MFVKFIFWCLNISVKNTLSAIKNNIVTRYPSNNGLLNQAKSTNINILLNRVKQDQKNESRKKLLFSAAASLGVLLFGALIF